MTYRAGDVHGLANAMVSLMKEPALLARMQAESVAIARSHDIDSAAAAIEEIVKKGLER